ncbi:KxYKxGKxW signal peptide domain-containing protein [Weissella hellenica]|uniref:KxYKxGKxW signal peptide domain-containing protein n=1 Tax=Weissella hellenica TaxID=46256 RepID=UPI003F975C90
MGQNKIHYKMYKDGKKWVFTGLAATAISIGLTSMDASVYADQNIAIGVKSHVNTDDKGFVLEEATPESEAAVSEEVAPESEAAVSEEVAPESEAAVSEEVAPESEAAVSEEATPESEAAVSEEATPESEVATSNCDTNGVVQLSYKDAINQLAEVNQDYTKVTKDNFLDFFILNKDACYDKKTVLSL